MAAELTDATKHLRTRRGLAPGVADLVAALAQWRKWVVLGWYDLHIGHRRTVVGPLWQTVQVAFWVLGLGLVFRYSLFEGYPNYLPYVAVGVVVWNFLSASVAGGANVFASNAKLIRNVGNPLLIHCFRHIVHSLARLTFQFPVFLLVLPLSHVEVSPAMVLVLPGFLMLVLTAAWVVPLMGMIGARFRDTPYAMSSVMRFLFFTSPVFWVAEGLGRREYVATYNPFTHYLEVVRAPLLGEMPAAESWIVVATLTAVGAAVTLWLFNRYRRVIVFWL